MKGCLKLSSIPIPGLNPQVQHLNSPNERRGGAPCCPTPATSSDSTAIATLCTTPSQQTHRKCVAFCAEGSETVYTADEWDRTPIEPARKLSYQDLLELKEIQRSLPHANQPPDVITGRSGKQFLSTVPIVLLPLLGADASGGNGEATEAKKQPCISDGHGRVNGHTKAHAPGNGIGWGPPSLTRQAESTSVRPPFPFPPRPVPFSAPASKSTFTSAQAPPSPVTQPWHMNFQSQQKAGHSPTSPPRTCPTSPPPPTSPTSPYPSYSNRPPTTPASSTYPYSNFRQQPSRASWTPPPSLSHLKPSLPIKPREKPKFEFITLLDTGAGTNGSSGSSDLGEANGVGNVGVATADVGPEALLRPISKLRSTLIGIGKEGGHNEHEDEDHDQDHDLISVTSSSSSCPSLCTSSCPSCSTSEADTDQEHEHEHNVQIKGQHYPGLGGSGYGAGKAWGDEKGNGNGAAKLRRSMLSFSPPPDPDVLDDVDKVPVVKKKLKKKKFIMVNDMEIELDDSGSESESEGKQDYARMTSSSTSTITGTTPTAIAGGNGGGPPSPSSITVPVAVKPALWGSAPPAPSASLITPPTTPPENSSRNSSYINMNNNKPLHSPTSPSSVNRRRIKAVQKMGGSSSRERSASMGSDTNDGWW